MMVLFNRLISLGLYILLWFIALRDQDIPKMLKLLGKEKVNGG